jgi:inner membrane protein
MNPIEHLLIGWATANAVALDRRDRAIVTLASVLPDLDGFGLVPELVTRGTSHELFWWTDYHHLLGHNLAFALVVTALAAALGHARLKTALLALASVHLHLLGDVVGARGPDGYQWPIPYLLPFSDRWQWSWSGQWALNAWQNFAIAIPLLAWTLWMAWKRGRSPLELVSTRANDALVTTLRTRFSA